jgi:hypothetical protein
MKFAKVYQFCKSFKRKFTYWINILQAHRRNRIDSCESSS